MASGLAHDGDAVQLLDTPGLVVEPAAVTWARHLAPWLRPNTSEAEVAERIAVVLADDLRAHHVALCRVDGDDYVVLGSSGLSAGARCMRLSQRHPVVNVCRGFGGTLRRDEDDQGPRAPGLPGSSSPAYAMLMLDDAGPVDLVTISASRLSAGQVDQVRRLLEDLPWGPPRR